MSISGVEVGFLLVDKFSQLHNRYFHPRATYVCIMYFINKLKTFVSSFNLTGTLLDRDTTVFNISTHPPTSTKSTQAVISKTHNNFEHKLTSLIEAPRHKLSRSTNTSSRPTTKQYIQTSGIGSSIQTERSSIILQIRWWERCYTIIPFQKRHVQDKYKSFPVGSKYIFFGTFG